MAPTTLHNHALAGEDDEIRRIASRGTALEAQDASGWTALHYAAAADRPSTVGVLLGLGADPAASTTAAHRLTPLHLAVSCLGGEETLELLIRHRSPLDAKDELGQTALHLAVSVRHTTAVTLLLEAVRRPPPQPLLSLVCPADASP